MLARRFVGVCVAALVVCALMLAGCAVDSPQQDSSETSSSSAGAQQSSPALNQKDTATAANILRIESSAGVCEAQLEDNDATAELMRLLQDGPITVDIHEYGGFEKIGNLPWSLPTADEQITAMPGDIVLYQGNQISFFYGSNSWSYTRLGHVSDTGDISLLEALGGSENASVKLSLG